MAWEEEQEIARLVAVLQSGRATDSDRSRFHRLLYRRVAGFFPRRLLSTADVEDLTQAVFLRVYQSIGGLHDRETFPGWLRKIAKSIFLNEMRRRHTEGRRGVEVSLDDGSEDEHRPLYAAIANQASMSQSPLEDLLEKERHERLVAAIRELPPKMRQCFYLRYYRGFKYREIAVLMKISVQSVRAHLHQAKLRLKLDLEDDAEE